MMRRAFLQVTAAAAAPASAPMPTGVRRGHVLVANPAESELLLFGGTEPPEASGFEALWSYRESKWTRLSDGPRARGLSGGAFDRKRGVFVVYGGITGRTGTRYADVWEWNGREWREIIRPDANLDELPGPRDHHAMVYDIARERIVLHGGSVLINDEAQTWYRETWEYDGFRWHKQTAHTPGTRAHHAMVYDPIRKLTLLYGGLNRERQHPPETWAWNGESWRKLAEDGPGSRARHRLAFHEPTGEVVLYGGNIPHNGQGFNVVGDTWTWDGAKWTKREPAHSPGPRFMHAMAYHAPSKGVVLYGGVFNERNSDNAWVWDGTDWSKV